MGPSSTRAGTPGGGRKTSTQPSPLCAVAERSSLRVAFAPNTPPPLAMYPGYGYPYPGAPPPGYPPGYGMPPGAPPPPYGYPPGYPPPPGFPPGLLFAVLSA